MAANSAASDRTPPLRLRAGELRDLANLVALENRVFATDRLSRRSLRHFLTSATAAVTVAEEADGAIVGTAILLFRPRSRIARLYSISVAPERTGRGIAALLLDATETVAAGRACNAIRLEVHTGNAAAISRYRKSGYCEFGRYPAYYQDGGDALRFEKQLTAPPPGTSS
jgi:ribosomal protein S18 acetylase RimI-like enzyme